MKQEYRISEFKEKVRIQTRTFGKRIITGEIVLYVLLKDHHEEFSHMLGDTLFYRPSEIIKRIESRNDSLQKKSGPLIIESKLERVFRELDKNDDITELMILLLTYDAIPAFYIEYINQELVHKCMNKKRLFCLEENKINEEVQFEHCVDLTYFVSKNEIMFYGREKELDELISVMLCCHKKNAILIGEAGVGKTAIVEAFAHKINIGNVPEELLNCKVLSLNLASLLGGASGRGDFEERVKILIENLEKSVYPIILFIDEFHSIVGLGNDGNYDFANLLKPILARNKISCIGATTFREYKMYIEKDGALIRRFQNIFVSELTIEEAISMLGEIKVEYEKYHGVIYDDDAVRACVELTNEYIPNRRLPDKALDVIDEIGVIAKRKKIPTVTRDMIEELLSNKLHIEIGKGERKYSKLEQFENYLNRIIGYQIQKEQIKKLLCLSQIMPEYTSMQNIVIQFKGYNDIGKDKILYAIKDTYFPTSDEFLELDMGEYREKHMISKLIGAPPGYMDSKEGGIMIDALKKSPSIMCVIKNINDAHPDIIDFLSKMLSGGKITDTYGNILQMKRAIVIIDNCGSEEKDIPKLAELLLGKIDFKALPKEELRSIANMCIDKLCGIIFDDVKKIFLHPSIECWLDHCVEENSSEKEIWSYIFECAEEILYDYRTKVHISEKCIELYQMNNELKYRIVEEKVC